MIALKTAHLLIFLPFLTSILCQISRKKIIANSIFSLQIIGIFALILFFFLKISKNEIIENNLNIFPVSIGLEFKINSISLLFLSIIIFTKSLLLFFYQSEIKNNSLFLSVNSLNIFAIIGILTTNNLFNLLVFIEIYAISFFTIFLISNNKKILEISLNQFILSLIASLLLIFSFLIIYLNCNSLNLEIISQILIKKENSNLVKCLSLLIFTAFTLKFFTFWQNFENLKNNDFFTNFLTSNNLFISLNIKIFLLLKLNYIFFLKDSISLILIILATIFAFYNSLRILANNHLKIIAINFCLSNFAFIIIALAMKNNFSEIALIFYLLNLNLIGLFLFIFASFLKKNIKTSLIEKIHIFNNSSLKIKNLLILFEILLIFSIILPFSFLFYASFNLIKSIFLYEFAIIKYFVIFNILLTIFCYISFVFKVISAIHNKENSDEIYDFEIANKQYLIYLTSFSLILFLSFIAFLNANFFNFLN